MVEGVPFYEDRLTVDGTRQYTVFAPDDSAFDRIPRTVLQRLAL